MSEWKGFLAESKHYMNYPHCGRFYFWRRLPGAWFQYTRFSLKGRLIAYFDREVSKSGDGKERT
ncbi:MAG: hypothetical protein A2428_03045 [Bdellovibrionales bacterium RIFOXYC1_FULL_54_43]|nr:MAG: hypothetical protein A2428_03045 [Bdellovibrionales bacterium RIFOXYC1_FULL_54_43]OFZ82658.1 MAG: hypothetical protein A2603_02480 [Bdellovibrionales bacterium RIFOXYD1_FULL_55_31]